MAIGGLVKPHVGPVGHLHRVAELGVNQRVLVFIDEHQDTLVDAQFGNPVQMPYWPDMWFDKPADRHNQGGCLSFADGHAERWRWKVSKTPAYAGQSPTPGEMPDFLRV